MNGEAQVELMKLIIGYTLVGVFVFTAVATCLAMVGIIKFADKSQYNRLFTCLIIEVVGGCVAMFTGMINLSPANTVQKIEQPLIEQKQNAEAKTVQLNQTLSSLQTDLSQAQEKLASASESSKKSEASLAAASKTNEELQSNLAALKDRLTASPPATDNAELMKQIELLKRQNDELRIINDSMKKEPRLKKQM